ncbi:NRDE family protein [Engelhardtia mirabilis]|uniref:NRDE family protein n=1 Tax=Engelhardtia mirabilis TaxID=2528011 RepID=A0A518BF21_9BACT|nr:hypothetical protein Pla133_06530 [Planctomycetes bacterium Pla133]QDU99913.1 hypothetical protein Pla86_06520 [Planctomycetes bacterium Pla86]
MCTVTWVGSVGGFELFTNRDELRTRPPAHPPRLQHTPSGLRFLAPVDEQGGGTWIAANECGVALCLLNHYQAAPLPAGIQPRSRGLVVQDLIDASSLDEAFDALQAMDLSAVRGFRLIGLEPGGDPRLGAWDTRSLELLAGDAVRAPLISSGFDYPGVERARQRTFEELQSELGGVSPRMLEQFHASERPEPGPYAVSMTRDDAWTVSHTRVVVSADAVQMHYHSGRPSAGGPIVSEQLPLRP